MLPVVVESKPADTFYIIRQGQASLTPEIPISGEDSTQVLQVGDFFGVVSCMSGHSHIETVQTISEVSVIAVGKDQFGMLIQKNAPIAMKIIRYFSQRLRAIDRAITNISYHAVVDENPEKMFNIGEYYYEKEEFVRATYAYQNYLKFFPVGSFAKDVKAKLTAMNASLQLPPKNRQNLVASFKDNETIFIEHEPGSELYIIQQGSVKITKIVDQNEVLLAVLNSSDIFGEMALLENKPRSATAVAYGNVTVLAINKENFEGMVQAQPQLAVKLITLLSERIWTAYRQLANLLIVDPIGRSYDMLLTLVEKKQIPIQSKMSYTYDIGSKELSNMLGFAPADAEKNIFQLLQNKIFRLDGGRLTCLDLLELHKQVQFFRKKTAMERKRELSKISR